MAGKLNETGGEDSSVNNSSGGSDKKKSKVVPKRRDSMSSLAIQEQKSSEIVEQSLVGRFNRAFDAEVNIQHLIQHWNRRELKMIRAFPDDVTDEKAEKNDDKKKGKGKKEVDIQAEKEEEKLRLEAELAQDWVGVEFFEHQFDQEPSIEVLADFLPDKADILEGLGLGPNGPPIPEPTIFSVVPMPLTREPPLASGKKNFEFIATGPDDPNADQNENDELASADQDSLADEQKQREAASAKRNKQKDKNRSKSASKGKQTPKTPTEDEVKKILRLAKYR